MVAPPSPVPPAGVAPDAGSGGDRTAGDGTGTGNGAEPAGRARLLAREWPLTSVATLLLAGLVLTTLSGNRPLFKVGGVLIAAALCLAAVLRAVLPERRVGLLTARSRGFDATALALAAALALTLALTIPYEAAPT